MGIDSDFIFYIGPCSQNWNITIIDGRCPVFQEKENEMFCILQGQHNTCVDLRGEGSVPGSALISWPCTGQWNQAFRLALIISIYYWHTLVFFLMLHRSRFRNIRYIHLMLLVIIVSNDLVISLYDLYHI